MKRDTMEFLLLLFALLLCAAVLSLRVPEPLEAEGEGVSLGCVDRVVLGASVNGADEPVGYGAGVYESIQARRLRAAESPKSLEQSGSALVSMRKPIPVRQSAVLRDQPRPLGCTMIRQRVTYYRPDGSIGSTQDTEVVQLVKAEGS